MRSSHRIAGTRDPGTAVAQTDKRISLNNFDGGKPMKTRQICVAVALLLPVSIVAAAEPPPLREGLWEVRTQTIADPGNMKDEGTYQLCRDHASDKAAYALARNTKGFTVSFQSEGSGKYSMASRGTVGGTVIATKGTAVYQGDTSVHSESHTTYSPALDGRTDETTIQDQKYVDPCPDGMKPGDRQ
jgi:hypothetical protein